MFCIRYKPSLLFSSQSLAVVNDEFFFQIILANVGLVPFEMLQQICFTILKVTFIGQIFVLESLRAQFI
jgi:hypothetical protein